jgi:hypothetical protein
MVKDMYAIYESYILQKEAWNDLGSMSKSGLNSGVNQTAAINDNMTKNILSTGQSPTTNQGSTLGDLGQSNEETSLPKDITKLLNSISACAQKADHSGVIVDCKRLREALTKYSFKRN